MQAGELRSRISFFSMQSGDDGYGNTESGYADVADFTCRANLRPRLGGEQVLAQRLTGTNFVNMTVRRSALTASIDVTWKAKDARTGLEYNIRSIIDPDQDSTEGRKWIELLCEQGVAIAELKENLNPGPYFAPGYFGSYFGGLGS